MKKVVSLLLIFTLALSLLSGCSSDKAKMAKSTPTKIDMGNLVSEEQGNTDVLELKFNSEEEMLDSMKKACANNKFELYYSPDNMVVALKEKTSDKITAR